MTNIKLTLKDKLALILMKIVLKMGYTFYTRSFVDTPKINGDDIGNKIAPFSTVFKGKEGERGNFENRTSATYNGGNGNSNNSNVNIPTGTKFISGFIIGGGGGGGGTRNGSKAKAGGGGGGALTSTLSMVYTTPAKASI